jgi:oligopeptide/dipeptide ABC transporter ATP-binding protein
MVTAAKSPATGPLLSIRDLHVSFFTGDGAVPAVRGIDLDIQPGNTLALVGESGSGKSVTAMAIMGLVDPPGRVIEGEVHFDGQNLTRLSGAALRAIRGKRISMVFQEPMTSLNPVFSVGEQIAEVLRIHLKASPAEARDQAIEMLRKVGISAAEKRVDAYPHELSGGMKQRVMIAMALACGPELLIADEPTTALDVTIQAQILDLLTQLQEEMGMAILLITHNLGVVAHFARDVAVMYAGKIVERSAVAELFENPQHPYTRALLRALPRPGRERMRLEAIAGNVPAPLDYPPGCAFSDRCAEVLQRCPAEQPSLDEVAPGHLAACWLHGSETRR